MLKISQHISVHFYNSYSFIFLKKMRKDLNNGISAITMVNFVSVCKFDDFLKGLLFHFFFTLIVFVVSGVSQKQKI